MKRLLYLSLAALMVLAGTSCKKENSNDVPKQKYGVDGVTPLPEAVDLGLSVKWASFNLGASKPEEYGDYYAWGETEVKDEYTEENYSYHDNPKVLPPEKDVAQVKLGGKWRMPTTDEIEELRNLWIFDRDKEEPEFIWDLWVKVTDNKGNEIYGSRIIRKSTGATLFLPAAGVFLSNPFRQGVDGLYFSSTRFDKENAVTMSNGHVDQRGYLGYGYGVRYAGNSIRPVYAE